MVAAAEATSSTVADALRKFAPVYIAKYGKRMPPHHRQVLALILRCKTGELGHAAYRCESCRAFHWIGRSCGNRHCPNCQKDKTQDWLARQITRNFYQCNILSSPSRFPRNCGRCCAPIQKPATKRSFAPEVKQSARCWPNRRTWAVRSWATLVCSIRSRQLFNERRDAT